MKSSGVLAVTEEFVAMICTVPRRPSTRRIVA